MTDDLDLFNDEQLVDQSRSPRLVQVLLGLLAFAVVAAIAVVVVAALISSVTPAPPKGHGVTLADVSNLTALDFPQGTKLTGSHYTETAKLITLDAQLTLPRSATNPFAETAYFATDEPGFDWPAGDLTDVSYWSASGELGTLNSAGLFAVDATSNHVVFVHLTRELG